MNVLFLTPTDKEEVIGTFNSCGNKKKCAIDVLIDLKKDFDTVERQTAG